MEMSQLQKVPKLTNISAATAAFSTNSSKTAILTTTNGLLVTNEQVVCSYCLSGDLSNVLG